MSWFRVLVYGQLILIAFLAFTIADRLEAGAEQSLPLFKAGTKDHASSTLAFFYEPVPGKPRESYSLPAWADPHLEVVITTDGLKESRDYAVPKPEGVFRIVTVGDSWTYGIFVSTKDTFSDRIEEALAAPGVCRQPVEVINLGMSGYDIEYITERFRLRGVKYEPDLVIYLPYRNDFMDWIEKRQAIQQSVYPDEKKLPSFVDSRRAFKDMVREVGAPAILRHQLGKLEELGNLTESALAIVTFEALRLERSHMRGLELFAAGRPKTYLIKSDITLGGSDVFPDWHPNPNGHRKIADTMVQHLISEGLIPCRLDG